MIYEYPDEFVVPVVYAKEFSKKPMAREWEVEYLEPENMIPFEGYTGFDSLNKKKKKRIFLKQIILILICLKIMN